MCVCVVSCGSFNRKERNPKFKILGEFGSAERNVQGVRLSRKFEYTVVTYASLVSDCLKPYQVINLLQSFATSLLPSQTP